MIFPLIFLQSVPAAAPTIPAGLNEPFVSSAYAIEQKLAVSDFGAASALVTRLPQHKITISWDDSKVPQNRRSEFRTQRDNAIKQWSQVVPIQVSASPAQIEIAFVEVLPDGPEGIPRGATFSEVSAGKEEVSIGLQRSNPLEPIASESVHNEVAFAIAWYLGLERAGRYGSLASRTEQNTNIATVPLPEELGLAKRALGISDQLRSLAATNQKVSYGAPHIDLGATSISGLTGTQSQPLGFELKVTNQGSANLELQVVPDCGCLRPSAPDVVKPGETASIEAQVNTAQYVGHLKHSLIVYSNDPQTPSIQIPVEMYVEPLYRFVRPGPEVVQMGKSGAAVDLYMVLSPKADFHVATASVQGAKGSVQFDPWQGVIPSDPEDPAAKKKGYKLHVNMEPVESVGRIPEQLLLGTDSEDIPIIEHTFYLQRGIIAMPGQVYLGDVAAEPTHFAFLVSRPGKPFKITKITSDSPFLTASYHPVRDNEEYRVEAEFDGHADKGSLTANFMVYTNDPEQPVLSVPVRMVVR